MKSAARVLEVFEYFDRVRRPASLMEIARALDYPQSSTTELLKSLEHLGYLSYDPHLRQYMLTHRVGLLGSWVQNIHQSFTPILTLMEELGERSRETIILAEQSGTIVRYIYVVPSRKEMRLHVGPGTVRPVVRSGVGLVFLAHYPPERVREILKRVNADRARGEAAIDYATLSEKLKKIRADGYHLLTHGVNVGAGTVSTLLPGGPGFPPLAIAIGGLAESIEGNHRELVALLRTSIRKHLGVAEAAPKRTGSSNGEKAGQA